MGLSAFALQKVRLEYCPTAGGRSGKDILGWQAVQLMDCLYCMSLLQILLISDYFYAFLRREYYLTHGLYLTRKDGTEAMLVLK